MRKEFFTTMVCYGIIVGIISYANTDFKYELISVFGIYTYMILMGLFIVSSPSPKKMVKGK